MSETDVYSRAKRSRFVSLPSEITLDAKFREKRKKERWRESERERESKKERERE